MIVLQTCKRPHQGQEKEDRDEDDDDDDDPDADANGNSIVSLLPLLWLSSFVLMVVVVVLGVVVAQDP